MCGPEGVGRRLVNLALWECCSPKKPQSSASWRIHLNSFHMVFKQEGAVIYGGLHATNAAAWLKQSKDCGRAGGCSCVISVNQVPTCILHWLLRQLPETRSFFTLSKGVREAYFYTLQGQLYSLFIYVLAPLVKTDKQTKKKTPKKPKRRFLGFKQWALPSSHHTLVHDSN